MSRCARGLGFRRLARRGPSDARFSPPFLVLLTRPGASLYFTFSSSSSSFSPTHVLKVLLGRASFPLLVHLSRAFRGKQITRGRKLHDGDLRGGGGKTPLPPFFLSSMLPAHHVAKFEGGTRREEGRS